MKDPSLWVLTSKRRNGGNYDAEAHFSERASQGFSEYDWWNFNNYLAWIITAGLEKFKTQGFGFPGNLSGEDEWHREIDIMLDGFAAFYEIEDWEFTVDYEAAKARLDKGLEKFSEYFTSLWD
jgi:hypothetical protein